MVVATAMSLKSLPRGDLSAMTPVTPLGIVKAYRCIRNLVFVRISGTTNVVEVAENAVQN